ncbi:energy transducer TonB [Limobrevibacterium gyesilva]|uniref:Energy transducer TonB n=1 Tax=Limobrevibacterium gyesilva TaxID=2991712 RepID=A0AA41YPX5_9PROT|nr:energy transducer TonB [Limobrevibacterium gyesilva]MCW3476407.1 energy transducer TonB [Limobrevibacterium gyesilva]
MTPIDQIRAAPVAAWAGMPGFAGAPRPLARPRRWRRLIGPMLLVSLLLHLAVVLLFLVAPRPSAPLDSATSSGVIEIVQAPPGELNADAPPAPEPKLATVDREAARPDEPVAEPTPPVPPAEAPVPPSPPVSEAPPPAPAVTAPATAAIESPPLPAPPIETPAPPPPPAPAVEAPAATSPSAVVRLEAPPEELAMASPAVPSFEPRAAPPAPAWAVPTPPIPTPARPAPVPQRAAPRTTGGDGSIATPFRFAWADNPLAARPAPPVDPPRRTGGRNSGAIDMSLGPAARNSRGEPPRSSGDVNSAIHVQGAQLGDDWERALYEWWIRHRYYPTQALTNGEDGVVQVRLVVERSGRVKSVELVGRSGSQWLDMGALAQFRNQTLPPFPLATPEPRADIDITIHYILVRR